MGREAPPSKTFYAKCAKLQDELLQKDRKGVLLSQQLIKTNDKLTKAELKLKQKQKLINNFQINNLSDNKTDIIMFDKCTFANIPLHNFICKNN